MGSTRIEGRFLSMDQAAISSNWRLGLLTGCSMICDRISFTLAQPLRIERGTFSAMLADVPVEYFDPLTYSRRSFSATCRTLLSSGSSATRSSSRAMLA